MNAPDRNSPVGVERAVRPDDAVSARDALIGFARADFWCFVELVFSVLHPGKKIIFAQYLEFIASVLMHVEDGKYRRVLINLPPRHMKSILTSVLYPAWRLGRDPTTKFICISYSDDLAHDLSSLTRTVMRSALYRTIFPNVRLDKSAVDYIRTPQGGYRYATAVGSHVTGFGADEIIIDDPIQPEDATSEIAKRNFRSWLASSVLTRFNDPNRGALILVMHRLAPDDPAADMESTADRIVRLPLVAEQREKITWNGRVIFERNPGDPLNPGILDLESIDKIKGSIPPHVFASQYQQRPTIGGSGMLSIDKWRRYDPAKPPKFELLIHSWDIGATTTGNASVCTTWGLARNEEGRDAVYLVNVQRVRLELPEVLAAIKAANLRDKPSLIIVDERGVGLGVYQQLRRDGFRHVEGSTATSDVLEREGQPGAKPSVSKIDRFGRAALQIGDGRVLIPTHAPYLDPFLNEIAGFPNIADKDQVDSMTQLVGVLDRAIQIARRNKDRGC